MINMIHVLGNPTLQCYDRLIIKKTKFYITLIWGTFVTRLESIEKNLYPHSFVMNDRSKLEITTTSYMLQGPDTIKSSF